MIFMMILTGLIVIGTFGFISINWGWRGGIILSMVGIIGILTTLYLGFICPIETRTTFINPVEVTKGEYRMILVVTNEGVEKVVTSTDYRVMMAPLKDLRVAHKERLDAYGIQLYGEEYRIVIINTNGVML